MKSGWQTSTLGDVLAVIRNGVNCKQDKSGQGDRISRIESIAAASFDLEKVGYAELSERDKEKNRLLPGDILFSHINSPVHVGKTAVFDCAEPVFHGVNLLLMRPKEVVGSAYLDHALKYLFQSGYWRGVCKQSVNQASVNQTDISRVEIRYPKSLAEQERIVGVLDEAFAGLATAQAHAEQNLKNARALFDSHLHAVFSQRGWPIIRLGDLAEMVTKGTTPTSVGHSFVPNGINFVKVESITKTGRFIEEKFAHITADCHADLGRSQLAEGDILFSIAGALGRTALVTSDMLPANTNQALAIIRLKPNPDLLSKFVLKALETGVVLEQIEQFKGGVAQQNLSLAQVRDFQIAQPPIAEQQQIVAKLDALAAETQRLAGLYEQKLAALAALKKSLLHQAFSGAL